MNNTPVTSRRHALKLFAGMPLLPLAGTLSATSALLSACGGGDDVVMSSVSFSSMAAPTLANPAAMATTTVGSTMTVNFSDATKLDFQLAYQPFFVTGDLVADGKGGKTLAGGYYDINNNPIMDTSVAGASRPLYSDAPDGTSLLKIDGAKLAGVTGNTVFAVVQFEYTTWAQDGTTDMYGKLPSPIAVLTLDQNPTTGKLTLVKYHNVDTQRASTACGSPAAPACRPGAPTCPAKSTSPMPSPPPQQNFWRPSAKTCMAMPPRPTPTTTATCPKSRSARRHRHHQEALLHGPHLARAGASHARQPHRADG
jgi:hypothetical protein